MENIESMKKQIAFLENKMYELQQQNAEYAAKVNESHKIVYEIYGMNKELILQISKMGENMQVLDLNDKITKAYCDNFVYEILDTLLHKKEQIWFPCIRSRDETMDDIIQNRKSIARFGDGEFSAIENIGRYTFQKADQGLAVRLQEVLNSCHPQLLIAIADNYGALDQYTESAANAIRFYMQDTIRKQHAKLLTQNRVYDNAYISRPYVLYKDWKTEQPKKRFHKWRKVWQDRKVIVVEGCKTRVGVGNDLLDNASEVKRILAPAVNSFDRYEDIKKMSLEIAQTDSLFLIALGPSAGVLAYDLTTAGYQALDIGHLDLEYEWFLAGKGVRVPIKHKYNNELIGDENAEDIHDPVYESQIIANYS